MSRCWIVNASPLILLGKVGRLGLFSELAEQILISERVAAEVGAQPDGKRSLAEIATFDRCRVVPAVPISTEIEAWDLGPGESQVLALTVSTPGSRAVLDDLAARRCSQSFGLPVIGTLGVVLRARRLGRIPAARPLLDDLRRNGLYVSEQLIETALARLGE
jgi:predicted nucleic acid-binding protein